MPKVPKFMVTGILVEHSRSLAIIQVYKPVTSYNPFVGSHKKTFGQRGHATAVWIVADQAYQTLTD